jgi:hypothetical protein
MSTQEPFRPPGLNIKCVRSKLAVRFEPHHQRGYFREFPSALLSSFVRNATVVNVVNAASFPGV